MSFKINPDGLLVDFDRTQEILKIPKEIDGIKVKRFKKNLFRDNLVIKEILIPSTVTRLNDYEFSGCINLERVIFEEKSKIKIIPQYCFYDAFARGSTIVLPDSITKIMQSSFYNSNLAEITLGENLSYLGLGVFAGSVVKVVDFSRCKKLTTINNKAFVCCKNLKQIDLSASKIKSVPFGFCKFCFSLTTVVLPDSVLKIEEESFRNCQSLTNVICNWSNIDYIGVDSFRNANIEELDLSDFSGEIDEDAFKGNLFRSLVLGDYIKAIRSGAFDTIIFKKFQIQYSPFCENENIW